MNWIEISTYDILGLKEEMLIPVDLPDCPDVVFDSGELALAQNLDLNNRVNSAALWDLQLLSLLDEDLKTVYDSLL